MLFCILGFLLSGTALPYAADYHQPQAIGVNSKGDLFVVDTGNHRVIGFDPAGDPLFVLGGKGQGPGEFQQPSGVAFFPDNRILVADRGNRRVHIFDELGQWVDAVNIPNHPVGSIAAIGRDRFLLTRSNGFLFTFKYRINPDEKRFFVYDLKGNQALAFGSYQLHKNALLRTRLNAGSIVAHGNRFIYAGSIQNDLVTYDHQGVQLTTKHYALAFAPNEPETRTVSFKNDQNEDVFSMRVIADKLCLSLAMLPSGELLMLRAVEHTPNQGVMPASELARLDINGALIERYPEQHDAIAVAAGPEGMYAFILIESDTGYGVLKRAL